jgi:hypothetical protein
MAAEATAGRIAITTARSSPGSRSWKWRSIGIGALLAAVAVVVAAVVVRPSIPRPGRTRR